MGVAFHLPVLEEHMTRFENETNLNLEVRHMLIYLCWKSICSFTCVGRACVHLPVLEEHMWGWLHCLTRWRRSASGGSESLSLILSWTSFFNFFFFFEHFFSEIFGDKTWRALRLFGRGQSWPEEGRNLISTWSKNWTKGKTNQA